MLIGFVLLVPGAILYTAGTVLVTRSNPHTRIAWWGTRPRQTARTLLLRFLGAFLFIVGIMRIGSSIDVDGYVIPALCAGLLALVATAPALYVQAAHNRAVAAAPGSVPTSVDRRA